METRGAGCWWLGAVLVVLAVVAAGCGGGGSSRPEADETSVADIPADTPAAGDTADGGAEADGAPLPVDDDGDTFPADVDCNDHDASIYPGAVETCNGLDDDCDLQIDEDAAGATTFYADADNDSFGDPDVSRIACTAPLGFVANADDCDDGNSAINPAGTEACDSVDNDCDGAVDEEDAVGAFPFARDNDGDNFGDPAEVHYFCARPAGYVVDASDCDDTNSAVHPGAAEVCNGGLDDDCDPATLEDASSEAGTWYRDEDEDGFGDPTEPRTGCTQPAGYVANGDDCEDRRIEEGWRSYPGAVDRPDSAGTDTNCDGIDGDIACSVFVSAATGTDANSGLDPEHPVRTLARAMAVAAGLPDCDPEHPELPHPVLVAEGSYEHPTTLALVEGIGLYGGYTDGLPAGEPTWRRTQAIGLTVITAAVSPVVRADAITRDTVVDRLRIQGTDITGDGAETIAVLVTATPTAGRLAFTSCEIWRGAAGDGAPGADGSFTPCQGYAGGAGGDLTGCASEDGRQGTGYNNPPGTGVAWDGVGGGGGTLHNAGVASCDLYDTNDCPTTANAGAGGVGGSGGAGSAPPKAGACSAVGAKIGLFDVDTLDWTPCVGGAGGRGGHGGGGGGGGEGGGQAYGGVCSGACTGSPGCWDARVNDGGAGGTGGTGGCGGGGGGGGMAGGSAFGVVLFNSQADLTTTTIGGGSGGAGGRGGVGDDGTPGDPAGVPGAPGNDCCYLLAGTCQMQCPGAGGAGGPGGNGAPGGGGSGGDGGSVVGIAVINGPTSYTPTATIEAGTPGALGPGGGGSVAGEDGLPGMNRLVETYTVGQ